ncbi:DNA methyltransferase 1-associated protein 1 [Taenia solium]|eukprot:TsM_001099600 transcript=TsM_001099600 gene=TsM_001099600
MNPCLTLHYHPSPPATKEIVEAYNRLRSNILLLYDIRGALLQCDYELHAARARMELFAAERIPSSLVNLTSTSGKPGTSGPTSPPGVDASVLAALKAADSKRPAPPRHSFGHAGSLAAAAGSGGSLTAVPPPISSPMPSPHTASSPSPLGDASPAYAFGSGQQQQQQASSLASQRRKRAAATEQGRVMKKLKTKGHLLE